MSPRQKKIFYRDRSVGFISSVLLHGLFLIGGGVLFAQSAQYAVEAGSGGIEVNLVAAPSDLEATEITAISQPPKQVTSESNRQDGVLPQQVIEEKVLPEAKIPEAKALSAAVLSPFKGDGSSPVPGKDATTFQSAGGAIAEAQPGYLKNPAPSYPRLAREKGWEGLVILRVNLDKFGRPKSVEKETGSGYDILDDSALKAVRSWKFRPAQMGPLSVDSTVRVPVRFKLDSVRLK